MPAGQKVIAIIPARFNSSRFPGKPLALILGKSLIQRTYESAAKSSVLDEIYIATDNQRIFEHVQGFGAKALMTGNTLKNGTERIIEAFNRYNLEADIVFNIQGDNPCLASEAIEKTLLALNFDPLAQMATACAILKNPQELELPNIVKCVFDRNFSALYFSRSPLPYAKNLDKTFFYHHIGIYAYRSDFLPLLAKMANTPLQEAEDLEQLKVLEHGYRIKMAVVQEKPLSVDLPEDIFKVEKALCQ
ncbi:MAG: 3-deoxy-manno-octulosonate cytidylyltransferase [Parachlamydiales bacterium]|jgi:3-deoxy-manno-octulosonate cytidylyltransferase (CMP-KDO synthetase)